MWQTLVRDRAIQVAFGVGFVALAYELLQVRMLAYFLGNSMDFLAIPIALLGLAIGSMWCHFAYKGDKQRVVTIGAALPFGLLLLAFVGLFWIANNVYSDIHVSLAEPGRDAQRLVVYASVLILPYVAFGAVFAALFAEGADRIGQLYAFDLTGAALGCVVAPLLLTYAGLPPAILTVLGAAWLLLVTQPIAIWVRGAATVTLVVVAALVVAGILFVERPDSKVAAHTMFKRSGAVTEVASRWNEIARTTLYRSKKDGFGIVQDNGASNVRASRVGDRSPAEAREMVFHHGFAWEVGLEPQNILVMFAGIGRDLVLFDQLSNHTARLTGVEINGAVVDYADHAALKTSGIRQFLDLDRVALVVKEGRDFLNQDGGSYDLIYVANNGAVHATRTGHTRKFLDTYQAMAAYLDHLSPGGLLMFTNQPVEAKIPSFHRLFDERGLGELADAVYVFGPEAGRNVDSLLVKPDGFSPRQLRALDKRVDARSDNKLGAKVLYSPKRDTRHALADLVMGRATRSLVTDDQPFTKSIDYARFTLWPDASQLADRTFVSSSVKIFAVLLFSLVSLVVGVTARVAGGASARIPALWIAYLLLSGVGYMLVEIGLIAKTELFVGNPLYAVAVNLASFLFANAVGAWLYDRYTPSPSVLVGATLVGVAWGLSAVSICNGSLLSVPIGMKVGAVLVAVFPAGAALGAWYPQCVARLTATGWRASIPMTYGLTTLASVLGSTLAMTLIIDLGFSTVVVLGAVAYVGAAVAVLLASRGVGRVESIAVG